MQGEWDLTSLRTQMTSIRKQPLTFELGRRPGVRGRRQGPYSSEGSWCVCGGVVPRGEAWGAVGIQAE